jgi:hypothetical protein
MIHAVYVYLYRRIMGNGDQLKLGRSRSLLSPRPLPLEHSCEHWHAVIIEENYLGEPRLLDNDSWRSKQSDYVVTQKRATRQENYWPHPNTFMSIICTFVNKAFIQVQCLNINKSIPVLN